MELLEPDFEPVRRLWARLPLDNLAAARELDRELKRLGIRNFCVPDGADVPDDVRAIVRMGRVIKWELDHHEPMRRATEPDEILSEAKRLGFMFSERAIELPYTYLPLDVAEKVMDTGLDFIDPLCSTPGCEMRLSEHCGVSDQTSH